MDSVQGGSIGRQKGLSGVKGLLESRGNVLERKCDLEVEVMKGFWLSVMTGSKLWSHKWEVEVGEDYRRKGDNKCVGKIINVNLVITKMKGSVRKSIDELGAKNNNIEGSSDLGDSKYLL